MTQTGVVNRDVAVDRADGDAVEALLASVLEDVGVLTGAETIVLIEVARGSQPGRVVMSGPAGVEHWLAHPLARDSSGLAAMMQTDGQLAVASGLALQDLRRSLNMLPDAVQTVVTVPLRTPGETLGFGMLGFHDLRRPREQSRRIFSAAASQLALAIQQQRLTDSLRDQAEESRILLELAHLSTTTLELDAMLGRFITRAVELTSADKGSIWLLSEDGAELIPAALVGMSAGFVAEWKRQRFRLDDQPLSAEALRTLGPVAIPDAAADPRADPAALELFGERALLVVPIVSAGTPLGTLFLNDEHLRERHTPWEIEIAEAIASQAGAAIQLSRLFAASEAGRRELQSAFRQFGQVLGASGDPDAALGVLGELALQMMHADFGMIFLVRDDRIEATAAVGREIPGDSRHAVPGGPVARAIEEIQTVHVSDARELEGKVPAVVDAAGHPYAYLVAPLQIGEAALGALAVARTSSFADEEIELLAAFGRGAAVAVQRAEILESLERRVVELSSLQRVSQTLTSLSSIGETIENIVRAVGTLTDAERCVVLLFDQQTERLEPQAPGLGVSEDLLASLTVEADAESGALRALSTGEPYVNNRPASEDAPADVGVLRDRNLLICPMRVGDEPVGVIRVSNRSGGFGGDDIRLLSIFAGQAAVVIKNVMLYQEEAREREQLEAIFVSASDAIVIVDDDVRVVRMNLAAEQLTGWTQAEALGKPAPDVLALHGTDGQPIDTTHPLRWVQMERSAIAYREQMVAARDGRMIEVVASYAYVPGPAGEGGLGLAIVRDLSAAKQVERLKSDFVSFVSHELRTPLSLIKGYASTLLRPGLDLDEETGHRFMQGISDAADRLGLIVNNLLNASRIESGLYVPRLRKLALGELVAAVVDEMSAQAVGRLSLVWEADGAQVHADQEQLRLVVSNIIGNAIRYAAPHGDGPIMVVGRPQEGGFGVEVTDNGPGISSDDLSRIFEKFYRGAAADQVTVPGSGLGLYICRSLIEAHGGRVWANSTEGQGTTVGFWLPAYAAAAEDGDTLGAGLDG